MIFYFFCFCIHKLGALNLTSHSDNNNNNNNNNSNYNMPSSNGCLILLYYIYYYNITFNTIIADSNISIRKVNSNDSDTSIKDASINILQCEWITSEQIESFIDKETDNCINDCIALIISVLDHKALVKLLKKKYF